MGDILRLDRRCEIEPQPAASVTTITEMRPRNSKGWLAMIGPHSLPSERLRRWESLRIRPSEMDIDPATGCGTVTYLELPDGHYEADSARMDTLSQRVVFVVCGDRVEVVDSRRARTDFIIAELLGITLDQLGRARGEELRSLRDSATAVGLVELAGTPKQVEWVERFRTAKYLDARDYLLGRERELAEIPEDEPGRYKVEIAVEWLRAAAEEMRDVADATWWIGVVDRKGRETLRAFARGLRDSGARRAVF